MTQAWIIGGRADCDLIVDRPSVSGRHCRLERVADGFLLEDLGSTNGTFVNGHKIVARTRVTRSDAIMLGQLIPMPWPPAASESGTRDGLGPANAVAADLPTLMLIGAELVLGRDATCDRIVDLPVVSSRHARLYRADGRVWIEDLGSSNGTYVNGQRIGAAVALTPGDQIGLGSAAFAFVGEPARRGPTDAILAPQDVASAGPLATPGRTEALPGSFPIALRATIERLRRDPRQMPVQVGTAALMVWISLRGERGGFAGLLSGLGVAAALIGLTSALTFLVMNRGNDRTVRGIETLMARLLVLGTIAGVECLVTWLILRPGAGLSGPWLPELALLLLTTAVGLALVLAVGDALPRSALVGALVPLLLMSLWQLEGSRWPLAQMSAPARIGASLNPARWAFEGLLLIESVPNDQVEHYFPAETVRMGLRADFLALASLLVGLVGVSAFFTALSARRRPTIDVTPP